MRIAVVATENGGGVLQPISDDGRPAGPAEPTADLAGTIAGYEQAHAPRWVWADTSRIYPALLERGVPIRRCYDVGMAEAALIGYAGRWGEPTSLAAAWDRLNGRTPAVHAEHEQRQDTLFTPDDGPQDPLAAMIAVHAEQQRALHRTGKAAAFAPRAVTARELDLLIAADSAGSLAATEMSRIGLPWRADIHDRILTDLLGARPMRGGRPPKLQQLAGRIAEALNAPQLNPDSPAELIRAFSRQGITIGSTRAHELRRIEHPAIEPLLEYKGLARIHAANGWAWRDAWVRGGRFRPEYVAAAVVSGRWATKGGGALQIPKTVRGAVVADPGWVLVVADARQLEPRVLAALSADPGMTDAAAHGDLYAALAEQSFGGDRSKAKVGLLSAMYGGASPALATLRSRYPDALALLEEAARAGQTGRLVRSALGRTTPIPQWNGYGEQEVLRRARDWGRFTRNFLIQASAADWAAALLASLRTSLSGTPNELVFFQHDEVVVHCPEPNAGAVQEAIQNAAASATRLVLGRTPVHLPLQVNTVSDYAAAK